MVENYFKKTDGLYPVGKENNGRLLMQEMITGRTYEP